MQGARDISHSTIFEIKLPRVTPSSGNWFEKIQSNEIEHCCCWGALLLHHACAVCSLCRLKSYVLVKHGRRNEKGREMWRTPVISEASPQSGLLKCVFVSLIPTPRRDSEPPVLGFAPFHVAFDFISTQHHSLWTYTGKNLKPIVSPPFQH